MSLDPRKDPTRHCLKVADWPEADRIAWFAGLQGGEVFDPQGIGAGWAPITQNSIAESYGRWLTWLKISGPVAGLPGDRVTPDHLAAYFAELRLVNASSTVVGRIAGLYQAIRSMVPERDWRWIKWFESRERRTGTPTQSKRGRLVPSDELLSFGIELMKDAEVRVDAKPLDQAGQYCDGLLIALLAARPLRLRNFTAIEIGRHLVRQSTGYWLRFEAEETKTHVPIVIPFPLVLSPYLERYLNYYRKILANRTNRRTRGLPPAGAALWVSIYGSAMSQGAVYGHVVKRTRAKFGHPVHPHLFRDCAATSIATEDPEHVHVTKSVLGHGSLATSEKYYDHARSIRATGHYQKLVFALRKNGRDEPADRRRWKA